MLSRKRRAKRASIGIGAVVAMTAAGGASAPGALADESCVHALAAQVQRADPAARAYDAAEREVDASVHASERRWQSPELMGLVHGSLDPASWGIMRVEAGVAQAIPRRDRYVAQQAAMQAGAGRIEASRDAWRLDVQQQVERSIAVATVLRRQRGLIDEGLALIEELRHAFIADQSRLASSAADLLDLDESAERLVAAGIALDASLRALQTELAAWMRDAEGAREAIAACEWVPSVGPRPMAGSGAQHPLVEVERASAEQLRRTSQAVRAGRRAEPMVSVTLTAEQMRFMGGMEDRVRPGLMVGLRFPLPANRAGVDAEVAQIEARAHEAEERAASSALALERTLAGAWERIDGVQRQLQHLRDVRRPLVRDRIAQRLVEIAWGEASQQRVIELAQREVDLTLEELELEMQWVEWVVVARYAAAQGQERTGW